MSKNKGYKLVAVSNEDVASASFIYLHGNNIKYYYKQDIVLSTESEAIDVVQPNKHNRRLLMLLVL